MRIHRSTLVRREAVARVRPADVLLRDGTSLPTGSPEFGSKSWQPGSALSLQWELPKHVSLTSTVDYVYAEDHGERLGEVTGATALALSLSERVHAHAEYAQVAQTGHFDDRMHHVSGGFGYHVTHDLQVDLWGGWATHHGHPETLFGVGVSHRWK